MLFDHTVDLPEDLTHLIRLGTQDFQIVAEDPDDDGIARSRQDLVDPLVQVGLSIPEEPRIALDDLVDGGHGLVERSRRVDADPVLAEVDTGDLLATGTPARCGSRSFGPPGWP